MRIKKHQVYIFINEPENSERSPILSHAHTADNIRAIKQLYDCRARMKQNKKDILPSSKHIRCMDNPNEKKNTIHIRHYGSHQNKLDGFATVVAVICVVYIGEE